MINLFYSNKIIHSSDKCEIDIKSISPNGFLSKKLYIIKIFKSKMKYNVVTNNEEKYNFYINSNFFTKNYPIGEVKSYGKLLYKSYSQQGGYFSGINDKFHISVKKENKKTEYSSQTHLVGILNGKLNKKIFNTGFGRMKAYRILLGNDIDGNLIIIHSDFFSKLNLEELCKFGKKEGVLNGLIYDGGSSIEVGIKDGSYTHSFHTVPGVIKNILNIHKPFVYIVGDFN
jgi:hypothetical protein